MTQYFALVLSSYNNQEGYLDIVLERLMKEGKIVEALDGNKTDPVRLFHDEKNNPYLVYSENQRNEILVELERRFLRIPPAPVISLMARTKRKLRFGDSIFTEIELNGLEQLEKIVAHGSEKNS